MALSEHLGGNPLNPVFYYNYPYHFQLHPHPNIILTNMYNSLVIYDIHFISFYIL